MLSRVYVIPLHRWWMMRIYVAIGIVPRLLCPARCLTRVHQVTQLLARLEEGNPLRRYGNCRSGLRVSSRARVPLPRAEAPKAADLHLIVGFQCADDGLEQRIDDDLTVSAGEIAECGDLVD